MIRNKSFCLIIQNMGKTTAIPVLTTVFHKTKSLVRKKRGRVTRDSCKALGIEDLKVG